MFRLRIWGEKFAAEAWFDEDLTIVPGRTTPMIRSVLCRPYLLSLGAAEEVCKEKGWRVRGEWEGTP